MDNGIEKRSVTISVSRDLQDLLRHGHPGEPIEYPLERRASIKDVVESLGIPHTEVGEILTDGRAADFSCIPEAGQAIRISAITAPFDVTRPSLLRPDPLPAVRFVVDVNVGRLAALLRLTGFDAAYHNDLGDNRIADLAHRENRVVLSKDRTLLKRSKIQFGRLVRAIHPEQQLIETLRFFGLTGPYRLFSRCLLCNQPLQAVAKTEIIHRLEPKTKKYFDTFKHCPDCDRIYWRGSHCDAMTAKLKQAGLNET